MIVRFTRLIGVLFLTTVIPTISHAEVPTGHFDTPAPPQAPVIWDLTGTYQGSDGITTITFDITQDDQGNLTGTGTETGMIDGVDVDMSYSILGFIAG
ncbi:MAG: hypothetical protein ACREQV_00600, partial [Candidatus Binatia bacterium]